MASKKTKGAQTFLVRNPSTGTFNLIKLDKGKETLITEPPAPRMLRAAGAKKQVLILGGGISGLTAAYDLLKKNYAVTVLEANGRTGGRSLTLRNGDTFTEVHGRDTWTQKCVLETAQNAPYKAYLNAGPGRIPSAHYHVLNLCKELGVELEVYIMQTRSNLIKAGGNSPMVNRRVANDTIGYMAGDLYQYIKDSNIPNKKEYLEMLIQVGALTTVRENGIVTRAYYNGTSRAGYEELPGTGPGRPIAPIAKDVLLKSKFWEHHFYQPEDFLWQTTSFQPVGGMDMIEKALLAKIHLLGGHIHLNANVEEVNRKGPRWAVTYKQNGKKHTVEGDFCLCNIPIPLMKGKLKGTDFEPRFWDSFKKVMDDAKEFLAPTCKVGWQAPRELWQQLPTSPTRPVIPIFGGISYTSHPITQLWYPSDRFHDELGVLTGAYNYTDNATQWGHLPPERRLAIAREGAQQLHGPAFARGLRHGVTIAWQNIPTQKGGWADWSKVPVEGRTEEERAMARAAVMNAIRRGDKGFFVIGDQVSWLPGWKEGAVAIAQEVVAMVTRIPQFAMLQIEQVPDTRALIQGHLY
jgi:monoamine oxidase